MLFDACCQTPIRQLPTKSTSHKTLDWLGLAFEPCSEFLFINWHATNAHRYCFHNLDFYLSLTALMKGGRGLSLY